MSAPLGVSYEFFAFVLYSNNYAEHHIRRICSFIIYYILQNFKMIFKKNVNLFLKFQFLNKFIFYFLVISIKNTRSFYF